MSSAQQQSTTQANQSTTTTASSSSNATAAAATVAGCCESFIDTLVRSSQYASLAQFNAQPSSTTTELAHLTHVDVNSFLNYCQQWQQKQCLCVFTNDELLEKFHHFLHNLIETSVHVIHHLPDDSYIYSNAGLLGSSQIHPSRKWPMEHKEKLLLALVKTFSFAMPLYITYKHLLVNHGRYSRIKECSCVNVSTDSLQILEMYCQTAQPSTSSSSSNSSSSQRHHHHHHNHHNHHNPSDGQDLPIELLRNICHFVKLNGLSSIRHCFSTATPDTLPVQTAHILFTLLNNVKFNRKIVFKSNLNSLNRTIIFTL